MLQHATCTKALIGKCSSVKQGKGNILRLAVEVNINDPTHIFGVYTCILDCGYGLASHMLGNTSKVSTVELQIPILS